MRKLLINKNNHKKYDQVTQPWDILWDDAYKAMMDLNSLLEDELGNTIDWGGRYAKWLNELGFEHQTENGWWNLIAIDPDNIQAFIDAMKDDTDGEWFDKCQHAKNEIAKMQELCKIEWHTEKIREIIEKISGD